MNEYATLNLEVKIPQQFAGAFLAAISGHDDDILLAAERAMREVVGGDAPYAAESIEIGPGEVDAYDEALEDLRRLANLEASEIRTYGPRA
jgi:hypothetical protein